MLQQARHPFLLLLLAVVIALPPVANATVVSPVPAETNKNICYNTANPSRDDCWYVKDQITDKYYTFPKIKWDEVESRSLTTAEHTALNKKFEDYGLAWNTAGGLDLTTEKHYNKDNTLKDYVGQRGVYDYHQRQYITGKTHERRMLFALYDRANSTLRLVATRVVRDVKYTKTTAGELILDDEGTGVFANAHKIRMYQTTITPDHFDYYKIDRQFVAPADKKKQTVDSINPFGRFSRQDDNGLFHNIDYSAALAAMGRAQSLIGSDIGFMAIARPHTSTRVNTKKSVFKKTIETFVELKTDVDWIMSVSNRAGGNFLADGITTAFCAEIPPSDADGSGVNCPDWAIVSADTTAIEMRGGNMPSGTKTFAEEAYNKKSGFSMLGTSLLFILAFALGGYSSAPELTAGFSNAATSFGNLGMSAEVSRALIGGSLGGFGNGLGGFGYVMPSHLLGNDASASGYQAKISGKKISYGTAAASSDDFTRMNRESDEWNGAAGSLGKKINQTFAARAIASDSTAAVKCLFAGKNYKVSEGQVNSQSGTEVNCFQVGGSAKKHTLYKASEEYNKASTARMSVAVSKLYKQQKEINDNAAKEKLQAVDKFIADDGDAHLSYSTGFIKVTTVGEGYKIVAPGKDTQLWSAYQLKLFLNNPNRTVSD